MNRRNFVKSATAIAALGAVGIEHADCVDKRKTMKPFRITATGSDFEREPLIRKVGFKGNYLSELWQSAVILQGDSGIRKTGVSTQSVLWSDAEVFAANSEPAGNALMFAVTERALQMIKGQTFDSPLHIVESITDELLNYGQKITGNPSLRKTFILNALVSVDNAAWLLYAAENGVKTFDNLIPPEYRTALSRHHNKVAAIPLISYNVPIDEIIRIADEGYFFLKIKIGQAGTQEEMLQKDMERLSEIRKAIGSRTTPHTKSGKLLYYLDANGRYEKKETLQRLIDHSKKIGAFDQIAIIEEPFPETNEEDVSDLEPIIAADESAHTDADALKRIEAGYRAIALKAIAKTMSMTMKIAQTAHKHKVACFCADLTVNPLLLEWNKNVAARLLPFPGLDMGLLETNGSQNYRNWDKMSTYSPSYGMPWTKINNGVFLLDKEYYNRSGGIFEPSQHYDDWFK